MRDSCLSCVMSGDSALFPKLAYNCLSQTLGQFRNMWWICLFSIPKCFIKWAKSQLILNIQIVQDLTIVVSSVCGFIWFLAHMDVKGLRSFSWKVVRYTKLMTVSHIMNEGMKFWNVQMVHIALWAIVNEDMFVCMKLRYNPQVTLQQEEPCDLACHTQQWLK